MIVDFRSSGLDLVGAVHRHLERRVRAALRSSATHVRTVTLRLSDVNGPRGGVDLHCAVRLDLTPSGAVQAEATDGDLIAAVTRAVGRAGRSVHRAFGLRRSADLPSAPVVGVRTTRQEPVRRGPRRGR
jgi:putative sigma-54 modulation protein